MTKNNFQAIFSERALGELAESWAWYEERMLGLGDRFSTSVIKAVSQLGHNPESGLVRHT